MSTTALYLTAKPPHVKKGEYARAGTLLTVEEARNLVELARRRPWEGDTTVIHITGAHLVRADIWNVLLKILEEPPPYVQFNLYAPSTDSIPGTIKSRSHVKRLDLPNFAAEDSSRFIRLIESGDALAILREGDRHSERDEATRSVESIWVYAIQTGRIGMAFLSEVYLERLRRGANPRVTVKSMLIELATQHKKALAAKDT